MSTHINMHDLLESGAHFGHQSRYWNPKIRPYVYGTLKKIHIINLQYTLPALRLAQVKARELGRNRNKLLFVGTKRAAREHIKRAALSIGQPYANQRWLGGMLTNYKTIRASIKVYNNLKTMFEDGTASKLTKKEALLRQRKLDKLEQSIGGIKDMGGLPDAVFIVDIDREHIAVTETSSLGIPIIALVDTNCDPDLVDYVIPANDDSGKTIKLIVDAIATAYAEGAKEADQLNPIADKGPKVITAQEKRMAPNRIKRSIDLAAAETTASQAEEPSTATPPVKAATVKEASITAPAEGDKTKTEEASKTKQEDAATTTEDVKTTKTTAMDKEASGGDQEISTPAKKTDTSEAKSTADAATTVNGETDQ